MGFLRLFDLGSKGAPQRLLLVTAFLWGIGRARYTSSQTVFHNESLLISLCSFVAVLTK